ncbi:hypothetical protein C4B38_000380, partial [Diabrotica virgifera virgifera]
MVRSCLLERDHECVLVSIFFITLISTYRHYNYYRI